MKTADQINSEIVALKGALTATNIDSSTRSVLEGIVGELEWVVGDGETISMSQFIVGAQALVKE